MSEKRKVYLIARSILNGTANKGDDAILAEHESEGLLSIEALDLHYGLAETVVDKAMNKADVRPKTEEEIVSAINSWIDYFFESRS